MSYPLAVGVAVLQPVRRRAAGVLVRFSRVDGPCVLPLRVEASQPDPVVPVPRLVQVVDARDRAARQQRLAHQRVELRDINLLRQISLLWIGKVTGATDRTKRKIWRSTSLNCRASPQSVTAVLCCSSTKPWCSKTVSYTHLTLPTKRIV